MDASLPVSAAGPNPTRSPAARYEGELSRLAYLGISEEQSADIEIKTADGDKVTIASEIHAEAELLTYQHLAFNGQGYDAEHLQLVDFQEDRSFTLAVEGTLDEEELADIQMLLEDIRARVKDFLIGNAGASAPEQAPDSYASLESYTADFEVHRELTCLDAGQAQIAQAEVGAASAAATTPQGEAPETAPQIRAEALQAGPAAEAPAQQLAERVREHRPSRKLLKHLKRFLKTWLQEMHSSGRIDGRQAGQGEAILNRLFQKLGPQGQSTHSATAAEVTVKQEWASLRYTMSASVTTQPQVEHTA